MPPATEDVRCRDDVLFYLDEATSLFSPRSCSIVARKKVLKTFLVRLGEEHPDIIRPLLHKVLRDIPFSTKRLEKVAGGKRCTEDLENCREAKKAKLEKTRGFVERTFRCEPDGTDSLFLAQDEEEQSDSNEGADHCKTTYTPYKTEFGLTHGMAPIHSMFSTKFLTIPHSDRKDGSRVFEICKLLKFEQVRASLVKFFNTPTKTTAIPLTSGIQDPCEVMRILRKINRFDQEPKIHKAFGRMRLFTTIDADVQKERFSDYLQIIDVLAKKEVGSETSEDIAETVAEYRTAYHQGRKWLELSESFGGTGIVFIIVVIRFGFWKFCHDLTEFERTCLGIVASHLPSIRSIVECLGDSALEDYCRHGSLPEEKMKNLEELKGLIPDADDDDGDHESDEDVQ